MKEIKEARKRAEYLSKRGKDIVFVFSKDNGRYYSIFKTDFDKLKDTSHYKIIETIKAK